MTDAPTVDLKEEARLVAIGEPVDGTDPLFVGTLREAVAAAMACPPDARRDLAIWTEGCVLGTDEIAALHAADHANTEPGPVDPVRTNRSM